MKASKEAFMAWVTENHQRHNEAFRSSFCYINKIKIINQ